MLPTFLKCLNNINKRFINNSLLYLGRVRYSINVNSKIFVNQQKKKVGPWGWFLLVVPVSTCALGTWQVRRKKWKEDLMANLQHLTRSDPIPLPDNLAELEQLEYRPIHVRGQFLHDKELHMGPRTLIVKGDASTQSRLMSAGLRQSQGYLVITPLKLEGRNEIILINRGWVPTNCRNPATREKGQQKGVVDVIGCVRLHEKRPQFTPKNQENSNQWFHRDLHQMARVTGALPVLLEATNEFDVPGGPVGGQTRITLRNEHLSYIITWYSLSAVTSYLWYKQFMKGVRL